MLYFVNGAWLVGHVHKKCGLKIPASCDVSLACLAEISALASSYFLIPPLERVSHHGVPAPFSHAVLVLAGLARL